MRGSTSEATEPRSQTQGETGKINAPAKSTEPRSQIQGDVGKINAAAKTPDSTNGQSREQDKYLPTANVVRIMRKTLPNNAKVGEDAKEMMQECVSEFISFCTSEANEACQKEHRRTITAEDLLRAMSRLGFDHYVGPLMTFLQKYRESEMLPMIIGPNVLNSSNTGSWVAGNNELMPPTNDGLPPFSVRVPTFMPPQYAMFGSDVNGLYYHNGSGQNSQHSADATIHGGNGHGLCSGFMGGQSAGEGGSGPSGPFQAKTDFYDQY